jgi:type II secretory pathway pseudopilin PulG
MRLSSDWRKAQPGRKQEGGYILLTMFLFLALLVIAASAILPSLAFQVRRDREEEMIHRGVQYSRAIRRYVKKNGRFPARVEDLLNTNNVRYLRKQYKDPITGKDFKLVHVGEVQLTGGPGLMGATPAANMAQPPGEFAPRDTGEDTPDNTLNPTGDQNSNSNKPKSPPPGGQMGISSSGLGGQVFSGGPIIGVVSTSKAESIRQFDNKNHYNKWYFIYDPTMDRGGAITGPYQPMKGMFPQTGVMQQQNRNSGSFPGLGGQNNNSLSPTQNQPAPPAQTPSDQ